MTTFVLVHDAWHGGWCYKRVVRLLRQSGHEVYPLTGIGERAHLMSRAINLDTHVQDVVGYHPRRAGNQWRKKLGFEAVRWVGTPCWRRTRLPVTRAGGYSTIGVKPDLSLVNRRLTPMNSDETVGHSRGRPRISPVPDVMQRCDPPEAFSTEQKAIWRDIVSKVRPGWFYSSEPLLKAYVFTLWQLETESYRF
jgi:hypothetical protein